MAISMSGIFNVIIILILIFLIGTSVGWGFYRFWYFPRKRKEFVIREIYKCLKTREEIYGKEIIGYCGTILKQIEEHCPMTNSFKISYTYADHEIGVNWYHINGLFEFVLQNNYTVIARIHYPG